MTLPQRDLVFRYAFVRGSAPSRLLGVMHRPTQLSVRARGRSEVEVLDALRRKLEARRVTRHGGVVLGDGE